MLKQLNLPSPAKRYQRGYTLVEILVVLVIFGVIVGGAVANYRKLNERKLVEGAARQAEQAIRIAQKNAAAGVKPSIAGWCDDPSDTLATYQIGMNRPGWGPGADTEREYEIRAYCDDNSWEVVESGTLPEPARFRWNRIIRFNAIEGTAMEDSVTQDVCNRNYTCNVSNPFRYEIQVTKGGSVSLTRIN